MYILHNSKFVYFFRSIRSRSECVVEYRDVDDVCLRTKIREFYSVIENLKKKNQNLSNILRNQNWRFSNFCGEKFLENSNAVVLRTHVQWEWKLFADKV